MTKVLFPHNFILQNTKYKIFLLLQVVLQDGGTWRKDGKEEGRHRWASSKLRVALRTYLGRTNVPIRRVTRRELSNAIDKMHAKRVPRKRRS